MIVEFCGVPGAGKTTLACALAVALQEASLDCLDREATVSRYVQHLLPLPRPPWVWVRRASTLLYRTNLLYRALFDEPAAVTVSELNRAHLLRSALRMTEDRRLYLWLGSNACHSWVANLGEGLVQHQAALRVWRQLLRADRAPQPLVDLLPANLPGNLVVNVRLTPQDAERRLTHRGIPALWPSAQKPRQVIDQFSRQLDSLLLEVEPAGLTLLEVDGAMTREARRQWALNTVEQIANSLRT